MPALAAGIPGCIEFHCGSFFTDTLCKDVFIGLKSVNLNIINTSGI